MRAFPIKPGACCARATSGRAAKPRDELAPSHPSLPNIGGRVALGWLRRQHVGWAYNRSGARLLAFFRPFYAILLTQCDALKFRCEFAAGRPGLALRHLRARN